MKEGDHTSTLKHLRYEYKKVTLAKPAVLNLVSLGTSSGTVNGGRGGGVSTVTPGNCAQPEHEDKLYWTSPVEASAQLPPGTVLRSALTD